MDDEKFFSFYDAEQRVGLLFDSVHRVVGAMFDGLNYQRLDSLSPPQKVSTEDHGPKNSLRTTSSSITDLTSLLN